MSNIRSLSDLKKGSGGGEGGGGFPPGMPGRGGGFPGGFPGGSGGQSKNMKHVGEGQLDGELAKAGGKLVVVDFTASWCGPCQMIAPHFSNLADKYTNVVFLKVDVDECPNTAQKCGVTAMPTFQFYKNKRMVEQFSGASPDKLKSTIEKHATPDSGPSGGYVLGTRSGMSTQEQPKPFVETTPHRTPQIPSEIPNSSSNPSTTELSNDPLFQSLVEMGFPASRAEKALKATGASSLEAAIDWCFAHPNDDEGTQVDQSEGPGKDVSQGNDPMQVEEKKLLTPEEIEEKKKSLQEKIQMRKQQREAEEKEREKERELNRRKGGQEGIEAKKKWEEAQREREAMLRRKEKEEEKLAKEKIRAKIAQDKLERSSKIQSTETSTPSLPPQSVPKAEHTSALIQVRLNDGTTIRAKFKPTDTIRAVHDHVSLLTHTSNFSLMTTFPKKVYSPESLDNTTLEEAGLVPNGTMMMSMHI